MQRIIEGPLVQDVWLVLGASQKTWRRDEIIPYSAKALLVDQYRVATAARVKRVGEVEYERPTACHKRTSVAQPLRSSPEDKGWTPPPC